MSAIAAINIGKGQLGLDEDAYRMMLVRVTGKDSLRAMSEDERKAVLAEMRRQGFQERVRPKAPGSANLSGTYGKVGRALWLTGWNLGVFVDRTDTGLLHFVERQTGVSHLNWVKDPREGRAVMEALKSWIARATGLVWPTEAAARKAGKTVARARKEAVHVVQHRILGETFSLIPRDVTDEMLDRRISAMGKRIRALKVKPVQFAGKAA